MKKNSIILLIGAALGIFVYRYFLKASTRKVVDETALNNEVKQGSLIKAHYIGPDLIYTGLTLKQGDVIYGTLNDDGSLSYTMTGNGIVASEKVFTIPTNQYVTEMQ